MPRKTKKTATADAAAKPQIPAELLEQLIPGPVTPAQLQDVFQRFKKAFIERALGAKLSQHLGCSPDQAKPEGVANHRNGKSAKMVLTDTGVPHATPPASFTKSVIHSSRQLPQPILGEGCRRDRSTEPSDGEAT